MLKVECKYDYETGRFDYTIDTEKSGTLEFLGTINLLMNNMYKEDKKITNDKKLFKALKDFRKGISDFMEGNDE